MITNKQKKYRVRIEAHDGLYQKGDIVGECELPGFLVEAAGKTGLVSIHVEPYLDLEYIATTEGDGFL